jgi:hypothetical protein
VSHEFGSHFLGRWYGANEKYLFTIFVTIGGKPILILKNNSCSNSLDEKK